MHGWAPDVIGAVGTPQTSPQEYLGVFFAPSPTSRQARQEVLGRIYGRAQDRDMATTGRRARHSTTRSAPGGIPDHALLQRVGCLEMPVFVANGDSDRMQTSGRTATCSQP